MQRPNPEETRRRMKEIAPGLQLRAKYEDDAAKREFDAMMEQARHKFEQVRAANKFQREFAQKTLFAKVDNEAARTMEQQKAQERARQAQGGAQDEIPQMDIQSTMPTGNLGNGSQPAGPVNIGMTGGPQGVQKSKASGPAPDVMQTTNISTTPLGGGRNRVTQETTTQEQVVKGRFRLGPVRFQKMGTRTTRSVTHEDSLDPAYTNDVVETAAAMIMSGNPELPQFMQSATASMTPEERGAIQERVKVRQAMVGEVAKQGSLAAGIALSEQFAGLSTKDGQQIALLGLTGRAEEAANALSKFKNMEAQRQGILLDTAEMDNDRAKLALQIQQADYEATKAQRKRLQDASQMVNERLFGSPIEEQTARQEAMSLTTQMVGMATVQNFKNRMVNDMLGGLPQTPGVASQPAGQGMTEYLAQMSNDSISYKTVTKDDGSTTVTEIRDPVKFQQFTLGTFMNDGVMTFAKRKSQEEQGWGDYLNSFFGEGDESAPVELVRVTPAQFLYHGQVLREDSGMSDEQAQRSEDWLLNTGAFIKEGGVLIPVHRVNPGTDNALMSQVVANFLEQTQIRTDPRLVGQTALMVVQDIVDKQPEIDDDKESAEDWDAIGRGAARFVKRMDVANLGLLAEEPKKVLSALHDAKKVVSGPGSKVLEGFSDELGLNAGYGAYMDMRSNTAVTTDPYGAGVAARENFNAKRKEGAVKETARKARERREARTRRANDAVSEIRSADEARREQRRVLIDSMSSR